MARHIKIAGGSGRRGQTLALGALLFGAGLWLAPAANADELVQLALLNLDKLKALSDSELDETRGTGGEGPEVDASVSDQLAVILWDETKRQGTSNTSSAGGGITVSVRVVED